MMPREDYICDKLKYDLSFRKELGRVKAVNIVNAVELFREMGIIKGNGLVEVQEHYHINLIWKEAINKIREKV